MLADTEADRGTAWMFTTIASWVPGVLFTCWTLAGLYVETREGPAWRCIQRFPQHFPFEDTRALLEAGTSWWPIGLTCRIRDSTGEVLSLTSDWFLTGIAITAVLATLASVVWRYWAADARWQRVVAIIPPAALIVVSLMVLGVSQRAHYVSGVL